MLSLEKKQSILRKLAKKFNEEDLLWALGASTMLYLRGRIPTFEDLDLFVSEEDVQKAQRILSSHGRLLPKEKSPLYASRHFSSYLIDGLQVDLISGFTLLYQGKEYVFPLLEEQITAFYMLEDTQIPLMDLEDWKHYYTLMGRSQRAALCEEEKQEEVHPWQSKENNKNQ